MASPEAHAERLMAGEHYGSVFKKFRVPAAIISESIYQQSQCLPEHSHELGFFTLIIAGNYSEELRGRNVVYSPHTVLWRQAEVPHKDKIETNSSRFFFVEIEKGFSQRLEQYGRIPDRLAEKSGSLTGLASRLRNEILCGPDCSPLIAEGIALEMLGTLMRQGNPLEKRPPKWLLRVVERLSEDFAEGISTEDLAADAGVHPVHLAAVFRRFYHETIGDYVQKLRVEHASELLQKKSISLCEIAYECGFADQSHFTRVFKRRVGVTPGVFRSSLD
ncbi:MAG TPA: AraC family transcriptional regulator [Pyrinomonadaceae bacterium]|jgi:AraC family transcriptional regulator|nr:AraC family transcriptional regulator [Pyrinomonadaceae bacterium]